MHHTHAEFPYIFLKGIVAKRKDSKYYLDKRTKDWIKIKNLQDDDFVVCGYILKGGSIISD
jgi:ATP-dependent DNA ligase